ncbi:MAG: MBL fold metallo-hydrolase [Solirubrobacterales bacterium]
MKLTVLGKSPSWQDAGGACSGHLVSSGGTEILLDCGNGVFGKLRQYSDYVDVDAVFISHLHADHFLDLVPFAFGLTFSPRQQAEPVGEWPGTGSAARPLLFGPAGAREALRKVCGIWGMHTLVEDAFDFREYDPAEQIEVNGLNVSFCEVPHFIETFAMEVTDPVGSRLTYGADCRPNEALVEFASDTDLLIAEATLATPEPPGEGGHMTPVEAGEQASAAGAARLLLTHISDELDPQWAEAEAGKVFNGPLDVAREGLEIDL